MPVLVVRHDYDGDWQMLCGGDEHADASEILILHKEHLIERDSSLQQITDLPIGWGAERESISSDWVRTPIQSGEEDDFVDD